jgi:UDP-glucuronate decarboxylase
MKILVTGDKGFIGSNLVKAINEGLYSAHHAIKDDTEIITLPCDVKAIDLENTKIKVDRIYHLAGVPSPAKYKKNPIDVLLNSVMGTFNILELAKQTGARVVFTSTIDTEKYYPSNDPRACYTDGKKAAEDLCYLYRNAVDVRVARLFSTYGEGMKPDDGRVIPAFIMAAMNDKQINIYGSGTQIDSFCYISDMIQGLHALMEGDNPNRPVELGNPFIQGYNAGLTSIGELANLIVELCQSKSKISYVLSASHNAERIPNIVYASKVLKWVPMVGLRQGLTNTIRYFKEVSK